MAQDLHLGVVVGREGDVPTLGHRHRLIEAVSDQGRHAEARAGPQDDRRAVRGGRRLADGGEVIGAEEGQRQGEGLIVVDQPRRTEPPGQEGGLVHVPKAVGEMGPALDHRAGDRHHDAVGPPRRGARRQVAVDGVLQRGEVAGVKAARIQQTRPGGGYIDQGKAHVGAADIADEPQIGPHRHGHAGNRTARGPTSCGVVRRAAGNMVSSKPLPD